MKHVRLHYETNEELNDTIGEMEMLYDGSIIGYNPHEQTLLLLIPDDAVQAVSDGYEVVSIETVEPKHNVRT